MKYHPSTGIVEAKDASGGTIFVKRGYQFKHPELYVQVGSTVVTSKNLTHDLALKILKEKGSWFRINVTIGWYPLEDVYWLSKQPDQDDHTS